MYEIFIYEFNRSRFKDCRKNNLENLYGAKDYNSASHPLYCIEISLNRCIRILLSQLYYTRSSTPRTSHSTFQDILFSFRPSISRSAKTSYTFALREYVILISLF
jgi:hypothetical protein